MLRHFLIYFLLSIFIVVFAKYAHIFVLYIALAFSFLKIELEPFFSASGMGLLLRNILLLISLPLVCAAVPALSYRLIKGREMPQFLSLTWIFWIILVFSTILVRV